MFKKYLILLILTILIISCGSENSVKNDIIVKEDQKITKKESSKTDLVKKSDKKDKKEYIKEFKEVLKTGDLKKVCDKISQYHKKGFIKKGMTEEEMGEYLGAPNAFTGIYAPGGISYGYGNEKQKADNSNSDKFIWFHFQPKDWEDECKEKAVLLEWDCD